MSIQTTITQTWSSGGTTRSGTITKTAGRLTRIVESVPGESTDLEIALVVDVSAIEAYYFKCDRACTIKTNAGGEGADNTLALVAGEPQVWAKTNGVVNPLDTDITAIFVTVAAGTAATLEIEILEDPTP
jgi:hypothetical protein